MKKLSFLIMFLLIAASVSAQQSNTVEMADAMRSSGKIYVVITTLSIVFVGLAIYLFSIDLRLKRLEKDNER